MMNPVRLLRLGLFQLAAGGMSVLFLGILNRVMRVELELSLFTVSLLVGGGHYLGALIAIPFGFASDRNPLFGLRRTPYIVLGTLVTLLVLCASPFVVHWLADSPNLWRILLVFGFFLLEGIGTFVAGTAYLALVADLHPPKERGLATGIIWTLLMVGIISTGIVSSIIFKTYQFENMVILFTSVASIALVFLIVALFRQEQPYHQPPAHVQAPSLANGLKSMWRSQQARLFAIFLTISMFSYFMQDVILEPFGGDVFGMSPSQTTRFNTYMGMGVIIAMLLGGGLLIPWLGKPKVTIVGCWLMVAGFLGLAGASFGQADTAIPAMISLIGLGAGFFTVGGVAMMMDMTAAEYTGLFIGVWTVIQAIAKGPASLAGGLLHDGFVTFGANSAGAYAGVFVIEALGLLIAIFVLQRIATDNFQQEVAPFGELAADSMN
jgi:BCD family chlorophyll transporter-like MFS transporter